MKLSVAIADAKAGPSAFVVMRGFEESIKKAAQYGYDGVELALRTSKDVDVLEMRRLLITYGLEVSCISTGQVFSDLDLYLTNPDNNRRQEAVKVISSLVELAGEFGGMVNLGRARGFIGPEQSKKQATMLFLDALAQLLPVAEKNGVTILIEPVNRYEINFINSIDECAELIRCVHSKRIGIMPDVFHMNIEDSNMGQALYENAESIKYIHLADSNRLAPGWGHMPFEEIFNALKQGKYNGWVSIEILPKPNADEAVRQAARKIIPMVQDYNLR